MGVMKLIIPLLFVMMLSACGPSVSAWRFDATLVLDRVRMEGAGRAFPEEYKSAEEAMYAGEDRFRLDDIEGADRFYLLAWSKARLLEERLHEKKQREEEQRRLEEEKAELLRREQEHEELQRKLESEKTAEAESRMQSEAKKKPEKPRPLKERQLSAYHTAKRGETLPLIAAQPDVYNDPALWPLLYRANRDQIKDPRQIWPGQVLRIPRNISREDLSEARRYSQERSIY